MKKTAPKSSARRPATTKRAGQAKSPATAASSEQKGGERTQGKPRKMKLVRDSFTMPQDEYDLLAELKSRCLAAGVAAKKSEILRAAVVRFAEASDLQVRRMIQKLPPIKTGRPAKDSK